ncbi:MAG: fatty acid desaturase [Bacteroidota bacterium]
MSATTTLEAPSTLHSALKDWRKIIRPYMKANHRKAAIQVLNSFLPFIALWAAMYVSLSYSILAFFGLAVINAFFLVRIFIVQHDCGHQSFTASRKWNNFLGTTASIFTTVPYVYWSRMHNFHHVHNGQMEYRGLGDIHFLTKDEYHEMSSWGKLKYRIFRNNFVQFLIHPVLYILLTLRLPFPRLVGNPNIRRSHWANHLLILGVYAGLMYWLGIGKFLLVQGTLLFFFGVIAYWFFYVQHTHEESYNKWGDDWDHLEASIYGSTYFKLPQLFMWATGYIGYHHIHHLNSNIPNYNLAACARENPVLQQFVLELSFKDSLCFVHHKLWDEQAEKMISFREYNFQMAQA